MLRQSEEKVATAERDVVLWGWGGSSIISEGLSHPLVLLWLSCCLMIDILLIIVFFLFGLIPKTLTGARAHAEPLQVKISPLDEMLHNRICI